MKKLVCIFLLSLSVQAEEVVIQCNTVSEQALVAARLMASGASFEDTITRSNDSEWRYLVAKAYRHQALIIKVSEKQKEEYAKAFSHGELLRCHREHQAPE